MRHFGFELIAREILVPMSKEGKQTTEETNLCAVIEIPDLNKIYVDDVRATLQRMIGEVNARP